MSLSQDHLSDLAAGGRSARRGAAVALDAFRRRVDAVRRHLPAPVRTLRFRIALSCAAAVAVVLALAYPEGQAHVENTLIRAHSLTTLPMDKASVESIDEAVAAEVATLHADSDATSAPGSDSAGTSS